MKKLCVNCKHYNVQSWHCQVVVGYEKDKDYELYDKVTGRRNPLPQRKIALMHKDWWKAYQKALKQCKNASDPDDSAQIHIQQILNKNNDCKFFEYNPHIINKVLDFLCMDGI
jgi:hypothetical protein